MVTNYPAGTEQYSNHQFNGFLDRVLTTFERTVRQTLDLDVNQNAIYTEDDLLDLLAHIAVSGDFANRGAKTRAAQLDKATSLRTDHRSKPAKALGRQLRSLPRSAVESQFTDAIDESIMLATKARLFTNRVDLAIDVHDWLFYGDEDTEMVVPTKRSRGTNFAYKFLTACVVTDGLRITIDVAPIEEQHQFAQAVEQVLSTATDWLAIRRVFLDRGFYNVNVLQMLEEYNLDYVVRAKRFPSFTTDSPTVQVEHNHRMERSRPPYDWVKVTRFTVPNEQVAEGQTYFVTNMAVDEASATALADSYRRRWGIETSYRVIGEFLPKTRSKAYSVRLYYFLFAVILYNLWVLCNRLLSVIVEQRRTSSLLPASVFGKLLRYKWLPKHLKPG